MGSSSSELVPRSGICLSRLEFRYPALIFTVCLGSWESETHSHASPASTLTTEPYYPYSSLLCRHSLKCIIFMTALYNIEWL